MTIKEQLRKYLEKGYALCHGHADKITNTQSGGRALRYLVHEMKLSYFMAYSKKRKSQYRIFFKKDSALIIVALHDLDGLNGYRIRSVVCGEFVYSKLYRTKALAKKAIKRYQK